MSKTVLLVGGTGRTGRRVLEQLLARGAAVRAIVRSAERLPASARDSSALTVVEADLLALSDADLSRHVSDCDAIVSCLGHVISLRGLFGPPRDLVTRAVSRLCRAVERSRPSQPIKFVLMSSVSVDHPGGRERRRRWPERALLGVLCVLVPPARDNQRAADFLYNEIGASNASVQWVVVRPDTLLDGQVCAYSLHESPVNSLFRPASTNMANVAHFMCDLVADSGAWDAWRGRLPVIVNVATPHEGGEGPAVASR